MTGPRFHNILPALFLLFQGKVLAAASRRNGGNRSDDVTVGILVCILLLLLLFLFLAWRRLSQESDGRYHPRRLMRDLAFRLRRFWQEMLTEEGGDQGDQNENRRDEELGKHPPDVTEDEEQLLQQGDSELEEEEEKEEKVVEEKEEKQEVISPKTTGTEPPVGTMLPLTSDEDGAPRATESTAEILLSDLHSFSGTAAWEDPGKPLHVTAL